MKDKRQKQEKTKNLVNKEIEVADKIEVVKEDEKTEMETKIETDEAKHQGI